ncbi:MAG: hypothetical protein ABUK06_04700 [Dehalococcoidales bacterium]
MKPYGWFLLVAGLAAVLVLLFVSRAEYNNLEADLAGLQTAYDSTQAELADLKQLYPPRDFTSEQELREWLASNDVSEQPAATTVEEMYAKGLAIQEAAARDGYLISVDFEVPYEFFYFVYCVTIIDGEIWLWEVETDEPFKAQNWGKVK